MAVGVNQSGVFQRLDFGVPGGGVGLAFWPMVPRWMVSLGRPRRGFMAAMLRLQPFDVKAFFRLAVRWMPDGAVS